MDSRWVVDADGVGFETAFSAHQMRLDVPYESGPSAHAILGDVVHHVPEKTSHLSGLHGCVVVELDGHPVATDAMIGIAGVVDAHARMSVPAG